MPRFGFQVSIPSISLSCGMLLLIRAIASDHGPPIGNVEQKASQQPNPHAFPETAALRGERYACMAVVNYESHRA